MKSTVSAAVLALAAFAPAAFAADLPTRTAPPALAPVSVFTWTGFYAGVNVGTAYGQTKVTDTYYNYNISGLGSDGWSYGGTGGFDYQFAQRWVVGVAGDFNGSSLSTSSVSSYASQSLKAQWDWALRGRIGYLITPGSMIYLTGGFAQTSIDYKAVSISKGGPMSLLPGDFFSTNASGSFTRNGWVIGAGLESRLWGNWFTHAEYLYYTYDSGKLVNYQATRVEPSVFVARGGLLYKFGDSLGASYPTFETPLRANWTGFYAGVQAGYGRSTSKISDGGYTYNGLGGDGGFVGLLGGFDWQFAPHFVVGVDLDVSAKDIGWSWAYGNRSLTGNSTWDWGARVRGGLLLTQNAMAYIAGGYGQSEMKVSDTYIGSASKTVGGFQLASGVETLLTPNVSLRAEFLQTYYGKDNLRLEPLGYTISSKTTEGKARVGITYKFGGFGETSPVLARY